MFDKEAAVAYLLISIKVDLQESNIKIVNL